MQIRYGFGTTTIGRALLALSERGVCTLRLLNGCDDAAACADLRRQFPKAELTCDQQAVAPLFAQLEEVLDGRRPELDVPLDLHGTAFQRSVWKAMQKVPRGQTWSYTELARRIGSPKAVRAVGSACARNPVWLLVPCHRILRHDGSLGGYGGGLDVKQELLRRERQD